MTLLFTNLRSKGELPGLNSSKFYEMSIMGGFSFDGRTQVYNPVTTSSFMETGELDNYFMNSSSDTYLRFFLADKASFLIDF
jgi:hypothetical protein